MTVNVTIVGGGIAGLSLGWELLKRGRTVTIVEGGTIGSAASRAATSYMEPRFGRGASRRLEWASLARWPRFARELEEASGRLIGLQHGQWRFALDDEAAVRADMEKRRALGWDVAWIDGAALRDRVPALAPGVTGAAHVRDPAWVDGPATCLALARAIRAAGGTVRERTTFEGTEGVRVLANGAGSAALALPDDAPRVAALKGTSLFYATDIALPHMLRHPTISIVPRPDGLVVGASKEPDATSLAPDPAIVAELHARAVRVLPALADVTPEPRTGWRAYVTGTALALGRSRLQPDLWWSLGHGGVGYLRAPVIAAELAGAMCGEPLDLCAPFFTGSLDALENTAEKP